MVGRPRASARALANSAGQREGWAALTMFSGLYTWAAYTSYRKGRTPQRPLLHLIRPERYYLWESVFVTPHLGMDGAVRSARAKKSLEARWRWELPSRRPRLLPRLGRHRRQSPRRISRKGSGRVCCRRCLVARRARTLIDLEIATGEFAHGQAPYVVGSCGMEARREFAV